MNHDPLVYYICMYVILIAYLSLTCSTGTHLRVLNTQWKKQKCNAVHLFVRLCTLTKDIFQFIKPLRYVFFSTQYTGKDQTWDIIVVPTNYDSSRSNYHSIQLIEEWCFIFLYIAQKMRYCYVQYIEYNRKKVAADISYKWTAELYNLLLIKNRSNTIRR